MGFAQTFGFPTLSYPLGLLLPRATSTWGLPELLPYSNGETEVAVKLFDCLISRAIQALSQVRQKSGGAFLGLLSSLFKNKTVEI